MNLGLILTGFLFFFVASFPGRTTFLLVLLATRTSPATVFWGGALAFTLQSLISVALGNLLWFLPAPVIELTAGVLFFVFAWRFWREGHGPRVDLNVPLATTVPTWRSIFWIIFVGEWGDVSQVAIATFSSRQTDHVSVFISAVLAFWSIAAIAVIAGKFLGRRMDPQRLALLASYAFAAVACYLLGHAISLLFAH